MDDSIYISKKAMTAIFDYTIDGECEIDDTLIDNPNNVDIKHELHMVYNDTFKWVLRRSSLLIITFTNVDGEVYEAMYITESLDELLKDNSYSMFDIPSIDPFDRDMKLLAYEESLNKINKLKEQLIEQGADEDTLNELCEILEEL